MIAQIITHGGDEKDDVSDWVHDTILRCRINAAFRRQVERRIYAAEGVPEEICPAPDWSFIFVDEK
jgi:hypothetical protein